ncbi:UDP-N-acetylmuramate:L-alanyl-gamma-D-glutamyl-meso-diaminopimelate ligase [Balneatrix alpica]|uniref:UDP-N-acetylmuramate--L-alanyl-gamma-D-glutamyl-meso-2,6-diaminoheptandioate ligase n=1 Tax=Balneatrix alpica TaxID=75684 RepID=A0ABV5ZD17_9GAMM|nr:UDP-N-acetylmuramate:L-alanyl-gamma-D-glutamyl-meso-diaminopimelate ligase [Balneatrix alpica]
MSDSRTGHVHILGICGTFMGSLALLAKQLGWRVSGADANVYPPMSTQLAEAGIEVFSGYERLQFEQRPDMVVVGNAMSRGKQAAVEELLNSDIPYCSGPEWLAQHVLPGRWVLAVAGTHGKTTTASMLAWILESAGMAPGFLIGGVPRNFGVSARLGGTPFFVVEADEYDSAFFDKRSKFVHYRPRTLVMNNLEYDHADIFPDLAAIQRQFQHLLRTVPGQGRVIYPEDDQALQEVVATGCWSEVEACGGASGAGWQIRALQSDGSEFALYQNGEEAGRVCWGLTGQHNLQNALHAILAARHVGVPVSQALAALAEFQAPKRRMEKIGQPAGVHVYDDFAHHPTAIEMTLAGIRRQIGSTPLWVLIEPRSNTMRLGVHKSRLGESVREADQVCWYQPPGLDWDLQGVVAESPVPAQLFSDIDQLISRVVTDAPAGSHVVIMSNGGFAGVHQRLLTALQQREQQEASNVAD